MAAQESSGDDPVAGVEPNDLQRSKSAAAKGSSRFPQTPLDVRAQVEMLTKAFTRHEDKGRASVPGGISEGQGKTCENPVARRFESIIGSAQKAFADPDMQGAVEKALTAATRSFIDHFTDLVGGAPSLVPPADTSRPVGERDEKLGKAHSIIPNIVALIADAHDLGVNSVKDLQQLIAVDQDLPQEPPPAHIIKTVNSVDPAELGALLVQHRKLESLRFDADLSSIPIEALIRASAIAALAGASEYARLCPAQALREAVRKSEDARKLIFVVESAAAALVILGFDHSFSANGLEAALLAVIVANQLPASHHPYFIWSSISGADAFARAHQKWTDLVTAEAEWSARLPGYAAASRPSLEELELAAAHLAQTGVQKLRAEFAGDGPAARLVLARIGLDSRGDRAQEDLAALLAHLRAARRFCTNVTYQSMFGGEWAGLDTPFEQIAEAITRIREIKSYFGEPAHGYRVFDRLTLLTADQLEALGSLTAAIDAFRTLAPDLKNRLDDRTIETLLSELEDEQDLANAILRADPERLAVAVTVPLYQVYDTVAQENLRRELNETLARNPLTPTVKKLTGSEESAIAVLKTVRWASIVRRNELPATLRSQLLSEDVIRVRERVRDLSSRAQLILHEFEDHVAKFEEQYGINGVSSAAVSELLARVDRLVEQRTRRDSERKSEALPARLPVSAKAS